MKLTPPDLTHVHFDDPDDRSRGRARVIFASHHTAIDPNRIEIEVKLPFRVNEGESLADVTQRVAEEASGLLAANFEKAPPPLALEDIVADRGKGSAGREPR